MQANWQMGHNVRLQVVHLYLDPPPFGRPIIYIGESNLNIFFNHLNNEELQIAFRFLTMFLMIMLRQKLAQICSKIT